MKRRFLRTVKSCSNERCFGCENERLLRAKRKAFCKRKPFGLRKRTAFSAHAKPPKKKSFFQHTTATTSHCNKTNVQSRFLSATTYCELAVQQSFFVKTSVLRLHCGNPFAPIQSLFAGVLQAKPVSARIAGKLYKIFSGRALNRGSQGFAPRAFWLLFAQRKK